MAAGVGAGTVRLGIAPIGWSNDDLPELGGDITLEQCLREAREAGYAGVEKGGKFPLDPKVLRPLLEENGLVLVSGWFSGELRQGSVEREKRRIAQQLALYQALDVPVMVYAETTATARRHGRRINHVHCKDVREGVLARLMAEDWSFPKGVIEGVFTVPGDGAIDFRAFAQVLAEIGYSGWVVVEAEQDPNKANPLEMARIGHAALTEAFGQAGFTID